MAEGDEEMKPQGVGELPKEVEEGPGEANAPAAGVLPLVSFSIWPPSGRTREAVIQRLVQTLTSESILSKRYGLFSPSVASDAARLVEEDGFAAAAAAAAFASASASAAGTSATSVDDGFKLILIYSRQISKQMVETVRANAPSASGSTPAVSPSPSEGGAAMETASPSATGSSVQHGAT